MTLHETRNVIMSAYLALGQALDALQKAEIVADAAGESAAQPLLDSFAPLVGPAQAVAAAAPQPEGAEE